MAELITALEHSGNNMYHLLYCSETVVCSSETSDLMELHGVSTLKTLLLLPIAVPVRTGGSRFVTFMRVRVSPEARCW
jgi:hypothetical protein